MRRPILALLVMASLGWGVGALGRPTLARASGKKPGKTSLMPPEEAYQAALEKMDKKHYVAARSILQDLLPRVPPEDRDLLPKVQLAIADAFYKDGGLSNYTEALNSYRNFLTYFPEHPQAVYAQYMVGMSMFEQVLAPDRDQTMTLKAIDELRKVETLHPDSPYADQAKATIERCNDRLAEKERLVGRFYQRRKSWPGAIDRYRAVLDKYPQFTKTTHVLLDLGRCYLAVNNRDQAQELFDRLAREDTSGTLTRQAKGAMADFERRREKEGEKLFGGLGKSPAKKAPAP